MDFTESQGQDNATSPGPTAFNNDAPQPPQAPMGYHLSSDDEPAAPQPPAFPVENTQPSPPTQFFQPAAPAPVEAAWPTVQPDSIRPIPVVRVLSPVGVEYVFMIISLFTGAIALTAALLSLVNGKTSFTVLAFPTAALVVSVPLFAVLFLRLKMLELRQPSLKLDPSKRRSTQFTQIVSFLITLFTLIGFVFSIFSNLGGSGGESIGKTALDSLCILVVFGGILAYYWRDEHKGK